MFTTPDKIISGPAWTGAGIVRAIGGRVFGAAMRTGGPGASDVDPGNLWTWTFGAAMRTGRPVEAARHGIFRARGGRDYVAGYRRVKLTDPEGNP